VRFASCILAEFTYIIKAIVSIVSYGKFGLWLITTILGLLKQKEPSRRFCLSPKLAKASASIAGHAASCRMFARS
jgi:hypothetical protein